MFASREKPNGQFHIYAYDLRARNLRRLTPTASSDMLPVFTKDGKTLVFARSQPNDGFIGPTMQSLCGVAPGVETFYCLNIATGETRQLSRETFRDPSCGVVFGDHMYLSAWNGSGPPYHFYEIDIDTGASDNLEIEHFDRTIFPGEVIKRGLMIVPNKQSSRMQELNLGEDGTVWLDDGILIDKAGAFGVHAVWNPANANQIYVLANDVNPCVNFHHLWRTDAQGKTFEKIL